MRLRIPLSKQKFGETNCGPRCLKMIADYFGSKKSLEEIEQIVGFKKGKLTFSIDLAKAAEELGYHVEFYTKNLIPLQEFFDKPEIKRDSPYTREELIEVVKKAKTRKIKIYEKNLKLQEILKKLSRKSLLIILVDWTKIAQKRDNIYRGHYLVLVGEDSKFVYVNNSGPKDSGKLQAIRKDIFDKARKSVCTDEDILVISIPERNNI